MNREVHVRIWERLGVRFPRATRQEWHNTNRSLGSRRSAETEDREVPKAVIGQFHSITSSAVASSTAGTEMPSASAVLRLITRSNLSGRCTGKSLGLAPRKILAT
jgi:hypothetical protein